MGSSVHVDGEDRGPKLTATPVASVEPTVETDQWRAGQRDILPLSHVSPEHLPSWPGWKDSQKKQPSIAAVPGMMTAPSNALAAICHAACSPRARPYQPTVALQRLSKAHGLVPAVKHLSNCYIKHQILKGLNHTDLFIHQYRFAGGTLHFYRG